jgi:hypothetical protein
MLRTGWPTNEAVLSCPLVRIGVAVENLSVIQNLHSVGAMQGSGEDRRHFALQIARDLFRFMASFTQGGGSSNEMMVVPSNILERWIARFEAKYKRDPNFMFKAAD